MGSGYSINQKSCLVQFVLHPILIFDRGYPSHLLFLYLQKLKVQFCFRMQKDWWKDIERFYNSGKASAIVTLALPERENESAAELGITEKKFKCRLVRVELEGGETEILLTSLLDERAFSVADMKELYGLRGPLRMHTKRSNIKSAWVIFPANRKSQFCKIFMSKYLS